MLTFCAREGSAGMGHGDDDFAAVIEALEAAAATRF